MSSMFVDVEKTCCFFSHEVSQSGAPSTIVTSDSVSYVTRLKAKKT